VNQYNDAKLTFLENATLQTGSSNDLEVLWLQAETLSTTDDLNDLWREHLDQLGFTGNLLNDDQSDWLASLGFTANTLNEQFMEFYSAP